MIAQANFERLIHPALVGIHVIVGALALAGHIKGVAGEHTNGFVFRGVVNRVFADELQVAVSIAAIEAQLALGQRHAEMIGFGVLELFHHPYFGIGSGAVIHVLLNLLLVVIGVLIGVSAVVNEQPLRVNASGPHELDLLGFLVAQSGGAL